MIELLSAAFAIGFLGSLHCIGMCGGLLGAATMSRPQVWWPGVFMYQAGRITTYSALGLLIAFIGGAISQGGTVAEMQKIMSVVAGSLIIILAIHIASWLPDPFSKLASLVSAKTGMSRLITSVATSGSVSPWYNMGLANGLLPCGLVYAGLSLSLTATSVGQGAATMFAFGMGTVPAMLAVPALMRAITPKMRSRVIKFGALLLILIGAFTIARGTTIGQHNHQSHDTTQQHSSMSETIWSKIEGAFCLTPQAKENNTEKQNSTE